MTISYIYIYIYCERITEYLPYAKANVGEMLFLSTVDKNIVFQNKCLFKNSGKTKTLKHKNTLTAYKCLIWSETLKKLLYLPEVDLGQHCLKRTSIHPEVTF